MLVQAQLEAQSLQVPVLGARAGLGAGGVFPLLGAIDAFLSELPPESYIRLVDGGLLDLLPVFLRRDQSLRSSHWARGIRVALELAPDADRLRLHHTVLRFLALVAATSGLLLAFDDLDEADAESREIFRFVCQNAAKEGLLVVASSRAGPNTRLAERERGAWLDRASHEMFGAKPTLVLSLAPLERGDVEQLLAELDGVDAPGRQPDRMLTQALLDASGGEPALLRVVLPLAERMGMVSLVGGRRRLVRSELLTELPRTAREMAVRLVELMPPSRVGTLEALAAYAAPCQVSHLVEVVGGDGDGMVRALAECEQLGVIERRGADSFVLSARELGDLLLERMSESQRQAMHGRIADLLATRVGSPMSLLAFHRLRAGDAASGFRAALSAGQLARQRFQNGEALDLLGQAVELARGGELAVVEREIVEAFEGLADVLALVGRWPEALEWYREATVRSLKLDDRAAAARNHRKSGELLEQMGRIDDARVAYERGIQLLEGADGPSPEEMAVAAELQAALGWLIGHVRGEHGRGIALLESCLDIGRRLSQARLQARAMNGIGVILNDKGDWAVAVEAYERALRLNESAGDKLGASSNYNNLAVIFANRGDPFQAFRYYRKSLRLDREIGNLRGVAIDYNNMGTLCFKMGRWGRSLGYYARSKSMALQLGDLGLLGLAETNTGEARMCRGELEMAELCLLKGAEIDRELGQTDSLAGVLNLLGQVELRRGDLEAAREYFREGERLAVERDAKQVQADIALGLAELALAEGDPVRAEELCVRASRIAHRLSLDDLMGEVYGVFGAVKAAEGEAREALGFFGKALEAFRSMRQPYKLGRALYRYGRHLRQMGEDGRPFLEKAYDIFDRLGARLDLGMTLALIGTR